MKVYYYGLEVKKGAKNDESKKHESYICIYLSLLLLV